MLGLRAMIIRRFLPRYIPASERPEAAFQYPELRPSDVEGARLFARREGLVKYLASELRGETLAEVGVLFGDFSDFILRTVEPEILVAIDRFNGHTGSFTWGGSSNERFLGMTHRQFYESRFSERGKQVRCEEGDSAECLSRYPDRTFDMIYIDAGHDYESVKGDADIAKHKIKPEGILVFNDYIKYSHFDNSYFGVIPVVNDLVVNQGSVVIGFALQADMYCDIAIRKAGKS
jgi:hypothetical protein